MTEQPLPRERQGRPVQPPPPTAPARADLPPGYIEVATAGLVVILGCPRCGCRVYDAAVHDEWHRTLPTASRP